MGKVIAFFLMVVFGLSAMACGDANASANRAALQYSKISAYGYTAQKIDLYGDEAAAALQQAMTNNGFVNASTSGIYYVADANWNDDKTFVTFCVRSEDVRITVKSDQIMPAGCVNVSSKETGVDGAVGVALLPKAADKLSLMLKNQIEGKAMPTQPSEAPAPAKQPVKPEPVANSNTAANSKK